MIAIANDDLFSSSSSSSSSSSLTLRTSLRSTKEGGSSRRRTVCNTHSPIPSLCLFLSSYLLGVLICICTSSTNVNAFMTPSTSISSSSSSSSYSLIPTLSIPTKPTMRMMVPQQYPQLKKQQRSSSYYSTTFPRTNFKLFSSGTLERQNTAGGKESVASSANGNNNSNDEDNNNNDDNNKKNNNDDDNNTNTGDSSVNNLQQEILDAKKVRDAQLLQGSKPEEIVELEEGRSIEIKCEESEGVKIDDMDDDGKVKIDLDAMVAATKGLDNKYYPISLIQGQDLIKTAMLCAAINTRIQGIIISGSRGSGKTVIARGMKDLLPPIEIIKGSQYNIDPENENEIDTFLDAELEESGKSFQELEREVIDAPFVNVPLNVLEDRLLGGIDVEASVKTGKTVFFPGLLAAAHRGVLYIDDINLLDAEMTSIILNAVAQGYVQIEREGISVQYPCRPLLVATYCPEEAEFSDFLRDRVGITLSTDVQPLTIEQKDEAAVKFMAYRDNKLTQQELDEIEEQQQTLRTRILFAREDVDTIDLKESQMLYLCEEAVRAGCQGHRGEIFAAQIAKAHAALNSRDRVNADDLRAAVQLAIVPRSSIMENPEMMDDEMMQPPPPPPPPPPQPEANDNEENLENNSDENNEDENQDDQEDQNNEDQDEDEDDEVEEAPEDQVPQEFMFDAVGVPMDAELLQFAGRSKSGGSGGRGVVFSTERGRYIKPMMPREGKPYRVAIDATLRSAAPYQSIRREIYADHPTKAGRKVYIEPSDIRAKKMARKAGGLIMFLVDASGSMALNRMNAAKGACFSLLQEAYKSRDKVCLIPFQGDRAELLLPPTRSISLAKNRLETMPCGGGSPLAHALQVAVKSGQNAMKTGDVGKCVMVLISDGRANVPLWKSNDIPEPIVDEPEEGAEDDGKKKDEKYDKTLLKEEVLNTAKALRGIPGFSLVVIDTENKFVSTGMAKEIAAAAGGKYHYIPKATDKAIAETAGAAIQDMKNL